MLKIDEKLLYPKTVQEAVVIQKYLRQFININNQFEDIKIIAGIDSGYNIHNNHTRASIVLLKYPHLEIIENVVVDSPTSFPYVAGLLSFREIPAIVKALQQITQTPDLLMVDGQGIAHPRRLGIATHLGILTNLPSIGVAKKRLTGKYEIPENRKGAVTDLHAGDELLGKVLRSKENVKPLFISPGNKIDIQTSLEIVANCLTKYKLPEPTRLADKLSKF